MAAIAQAKLLIFRLSAVAVLISDVAIETTCVPSTHVAIFGLIRVGGSQLLSAWCQGLKKLALKLVFKKLQVTSHFVLVLYSLFVKSHCAFLAFNWERPSENYPQKTHTSVILGPA